MSPSLIGAKPRILWVLLRAGVAGKGSASVQWYRCDDDRGGGVTYKYTFLAGKNAAPVPDWSRRCRAKARRSQNGFASCAAFGARKPTAIPLSVTLPKAAEWLRCASFVPALSWFRTCARAMKTCDDARRNWPVVGEKPDAKKRAGQAADSGRRPAATAERKQYTTGLSRLLPGDV